MFNIETIWQQFLVVATQEVGSRVVETWLKALTLYRWEKEQAVAYLHAPNPFVRDWVQNKYTTLIEIHLARMLHVSVLKVVVGLYDEQATVLSHVQGVAVIPAKKVGVSTVLHKGDRSKNSTLKPEYTFDAFVVGSTNSLSYAAAYAVSQNPGRMYNPLFIYGSSGVGKTHLLHAIANELKKNKSTLAVLYQPADKFVTEFIHAIRFENVTKFQQKYQAIDVLLIDDIQCIANKEQTQEAFFNTFNALYDAHKQIVFSSDTYPQNIAGIAERLRSRMAWGLVTDMYVPNLETKVAILKNKAHNTHKIVLPDDVAEFIASCVTSNVRELEGALIRVIASANFIQQPITLDLTKSVLSVVQKTKKTEPITMHTIIDAVHRIYKYDRTALCHKGRNKEVAHARHVAMYLMKKMTNKSLRDIGAFLGNRDHATVKHGIKKIELALRIDIILQKDVERIEHLLQQ